MKILRIRGENLASLHAPFSIDLTEGVLGQAGLFAIIGPTGAGKSTLLDAICLCLYDSTPRLEKSGGAAVYAPGQDPESALTANDQRNVLRRGAGMGWAEVDFRDGDGAVWTARWEVRRARQRAQGRAQQQSLSLRDAAGQAYGGTKTETLAAIRQRIGLDFEQFRRSVLLAQGDFAAFLRADQNERARLLEQMTGTSIYSRLSQAAYQRRAALDQQARTLAARAGEHTALSEDERAQAEAWELQTQQQRAQASQERAQAEASQRWHQADAALQLGLTQARQHHDQASAQVQAEAPRRQALARARSCWGLRSQASAAQASRDKALASSALAQQARQRLAQAEQALRQANEQLAAERARLAAHLAAQAAQLAQRLDLARTAARDEQAWIQDHPHHRRLADPQTLDELRRAMDAQGQAQAQRSLAQTRVQEAGAQHEGLVALAAEAAQKKALSDEALQRSSQEADAARRLAASFDDEAIDHARRELRLREKALGVLEQLTERARALGPQLDAEQQTLQRATQDGLQAQDRQTDIQARIAALLPARDEARRACQSANAARDAESLRASLLPEEPCPVCGSTEHPWAQGSPLAQLHDQLEARLNELDGQLLQQERELAQAQAAHQAATAAQAQAQQRLRSAQQQLEQLHLSWSQQAPLAGPVDPAGQPAQDQPGLDPAALAAWQERYRVQDAELGAREQAARLARQQREETRRLHDAAVVHGRAFEQAAVETERRALKAGAELEQARTRLDLLQTQLTAAELELRTRLDALAPALPELDPATAPPPAVLAACEAAAAEWQRRERRASAAAQAAAELAALLPVAQERAAQAAAGLDADTIGQVQLSPAPSGMTPPQLSDWLERRATESRERRDLATQVQAQATSDRESAAHAQAQAQAEARTLDAEAQRQELDLQQQLLQVQLSPPDLAWLLGLPDSWLQDETDAARAQDEALERARTLVAERQQRLDEHRAPPPTLSAEQATQALALAEQALAKADEAWSQARSRVQADDLARAAAGELAQLIAQHEALAAPWIQLAECIGQASGDRFKRFAQSLSLDALLFQANHHLRGLAPRYELERSPGTDLDLQVVDHDLGDERRAVPSLSGGEAFLVSLALALGLSSLNSRDVRLESLFIDEGFGTLDSQSLDTALAVLEGLQAEGRQVGIISHVGGLEERIGARILIQPLGGGRSRVLAP